MKNKINIDGIQTNTRTNDGTFNGVLDAMYNKFKSHEGDEDNFLDIRRASLENKMKNQSCMDMGSVSKGVPSVITGEIAPAFSSKAWWRRWEADLTLE